MKELLHLYRQGIEEFNARRFFEAHESLETVWRSEWRQSERPFFQGLVQLAVGFHHLGAENFRGAVNLLKRGSGNLEAYGPFHYGINVEALLACVRACLEELNRLGPDRLSAFRPELLPTIELGSLDALEKDWA